MNRFLVKTGLFATFLLFVALSLNSCRNEKPTTATVSVVDQDGQIVENAWVRLYPTPSDPAHPPIIIDDTLISDFEGKVTFDYTDMFNLGQAGFAVLDIEIWLPDTTTADENDNLLEGQGIIKVEPETANEEEVIIFPV